jgi:hypothetical protein
MEYFLGTHTLWSRKYYGCIRIYFGMSSDGNLTCREKCWINFEMLTNYSNGVLKIAGKNLIALDNNGKLSGEG